MVLWSLQHSQVPTKLYLCWWADPGSRPWWSCKWHDAPQEKSVDSVVQCAGRAAVNVLRTQNRHVAELYIHAKWIRKQTFAQTNFLGCLAAWASGEIRAYNEWNFTLRALVQSQGRNSLCCPGLPSPTGMVALLSWFWAVEEVAGTHEHYLVSMPAFTLFLGQHS